MVQIVSKDVCVKNEWEIIVVSIELCKQEVYAVYGGTKLRLHYSD